jgi:acetyl esterase
MAVVRANADTRVAAVVPLYGRFDLTLGPADTRTLSPSVGGLLGIDKFGDGTLARLKEASPVAFVKAGLPPFLRVHGDADDRVEFVQSLNLQAALRKSGVPCDFITIKGGGHGMLGWDAFAPGFKGEIVAWLQKTLSKPTMTTAAPH